MDGEMLEMRSGVDLPSPKYITNVTFESITYSTASLTPMSLASSPVEENALPVMLELELKFVKTPMAA